MMPSDIIYLSILFMAAFSGIIFFRKCSLTFRLLIVFLVITFCKETWGTLLVYAHKENSLLQNIYTPVHAGFFVCIYYTMLEKKLHKRIVLCTGITIFTIILLGILTSAMNEFPWLFISIDSMMLVGFAIIYFYALMQNPAEQNILISGTVWLNTSVIIYFTASFIFWASFNFVSRQTQTVSDLLFYILDQLGSLHYLLLLLALYLHVREIKYNELNTT